MDMFMDKLAHRLTAQEMIKANTAADTEELNQLKNRLREYNECLDKLKQLIEEGNEALGRAKADEGEVTRVVEEGIAKIRALERDSPAVEELRAQLLEKLESNNEYMHKECVKVYRNVQAVLVEESGRQTENLGNAGRDVRKALSRLNLVLGISIAALVSAVGGLVIQILQLLNFL